MKISEKLASVDNAPSRTINRRWPVRSPSQPHRFGAQVKAYQSQDQNYADLQNGRLDATLTDKLEAQLNFLSKPEGADYQSGPAFKDPTLPLDIAMGLRKNDQELLALINKGIAAIQADGTYALIQKKYFGDEDIYHE